MQIPQKHQLKAIRNTRLMLKQQALIHQLVIPEILAHLAVEEEVGVDVPRQAATIKTGTSRL